MQNSILQQFLDDPIYGLILIVAIIIAITVHEFAHAWSATKLGDDTPYLMGRVTLNPLAHLDPIGTVLLIVAGFGWGRPVLINPMRLRHQRDELWVALAGPASNILLAIFFFGLSNITSDPASDLIRLAGVINVFLAAFNMLPIPPLDGSSIIAYFWPEYRSVMGSQIGFGIIIIFLLVPGLLRTFLDPLVALFTVVSTLGGIL